MAKLFNSKFFKNNKKIVLLNTTDNKIRDSFGVIKRSDKFEIQIKNLSDSLDKLESAKNYITKKVEVDPKVIVNGTYRDISGKLQLLKSNLMSLKNERQVLLNSTFSNDDLSNADIRYQTGLELAINQAINNKSYEEAVLIIDYVNRYIKNNDYRAFDGVNVINDSVSFRSAYTSIESKLYSIQYGTEYNNSKIK